MSAIAILCAVLFLPAAGKPAATTEAQLKAPSPQTAALAAPSGASQKLSHNDGTAEDKRSIAGAAEWVSFTLPGETAKVESIRIHGSRYGTTRPPKEDIAIFFMNQDFSNTIAEKSAPYSKFERAEAKWVQIRFLEPIEVPKEFWVGVEFNAEATKGVYLSIDKSTDGSRSRIGAPGGEIREAKLGGDWMIEVVLAKETSVKTTSAFTGSPTVLAKAPETSSDSIVVKGKVVDENGAAVANTTIFAVQKIWPKNQYQQNMLKTTTDEKGEIAFEDFAEPGKQYAFLVTVVSDKYLMASVYRVVQGKQLPAITLKTEKAEPVTLQFKTEDGKPAAGVKALPHLRLTKDRKEHITYAFHQVRELESPESDEKGEIQLGVTRLPRVVAG